MSWAAFGGTFVTLFVITDPLGNAPARADRAAAGGDPRSPFSSSSTASRASNPGARAPSRATGASSATARAGRRARSTRSSTAAHRERRRIELGHDLVPAERRRDRRARMRPHRVRRGDRLALAVLVRVDQDAAAARLRPLRRRELRMRAHDRARDELGERARVLVGRAAVERHEDVEALAAGGLRERLEPDRREQLPARAAPPRSSAATAPRASDRGRRARSPAGRGGRPASTTGSCRCSPCSPSRAARARRSRAGTSTSLLLRGPLPCRDERAVGRDPVGHVRWARPSGRTPCPSMPSG